MRMVRDRKAELDGTAGVGGLANLLDFALVPSSFFRFRNRILRRYGVPDEDIKAPAFTLIYATAELARLSAYYGMAFHVMSG